jgi:hypothetical protein
MAATSANETMSALVVEVKDLPFKEQLIRLREGIKDLSHSSAAYIAIQQWIADHHADFRENYPEVFAVHPGRYEAFLRKEWNNE